MDLESAGQQIAAYLKEEFGRVVELREVVVERSASGRIWRGTAYCVTRMGDIEVGRIGVTEDGQIVGELSVDDLVNALGRIAQVSELGETSSGVSEAIEDDFSDLSANGVSELAELRETANSGEDGDLDSFFSFLDGKDIKGDIIGLLASGRREDLLKARKMMPTLLVDPENRGPVLRQMGELELRLGETALGLNYLEAAAREFADLADVQALEQTAALVAGAVSEEAIEQHPAELLLCQTRSRLNPLDSLSQVPAFTGLESPTLDALEGAAALRQAEVGDILLEEGTPAVSVYVIKSGVLAVSLETSGGGSRVVRCCFPGELVGESSVLEAEHPTCNATVTVRQAAELWHFQGSSLKSLLGNIPDLKAGIEAKRTLHRLDSFFSMNRITSTLDVRVRDKILECIETIRFARPGEILEARESIPGSVYLVVDGRLELLRSGLPPRVFTTDTFSCLRDSLHELPLEGDLVATEPSRLVTFNPDTLRRLVREAPLEVVAVLERLD